MDGTFPSTASTSSTPRATSTSRSKSSARCACSTARAWSLRGRRRAAAVGNRLAPGQQVRGSAHRVRQQDGPHRRELLPRRRPARSASEGNPVPMQMPIGAEDKFKGVIDLRQDEGDQLGRSDPGHEVRVPEIPAELQATCQGVAREDDRSGGRSRRRPDEQVPRRRASSPKRRSSAASATRTIADEIVPMLCGSAFKNKGVQAHARRGDRLSAVAGRHARRSRVRATTTKRERRARPTTTSRSRRSRSRS